MTRQMLIGIAAILLCVLLLSEIASAMGSTNYRLDWYVPLTGGGGGAATSTNYAINFTVGQSAIGGSSSANYAAGLGYWYGAAVGYKVYLPIVLK